MRTLIGASLYLLLTFGCGSENNPLQPPPLPVPKGGTLFYEPRSVCLPMSATVDTLFLTNLGDTTLVWRPTRVPAGSVNLDREIQIDPGTTVGIVYEWSGTGPFPILDTLVAETGDTTASTVTIPFRQEGFGHVDTEPPPAPVLALPADGDSFGTEVDVLFMWSRVSDCSGIQGYNLQIATDPSFQNVVFELRLYGLSQVVLVTEEGDQGSAFWRVRARDKIPGNGWGPWSPTGFYSVR